MLGVKKLVTGTLGLLGLTISRTPPRPPSALLHHQIDLVFDVGANIGQFAMLARAGGYTGRIVSFEPLPDAHAALLRNSQTDLNWTVHERCAVGASPGAAEINISANSYSSSLLPMLPAHSIAAPESQYVNKATTPVISLDSVFDKYMPAKKVLVKIDTQGFEAEVLRGAAKNLANINAVHLELSTVPLYEGQQLYEYFVSFFQQHNFELWSLTPGFTDIYTGRVLQFDATFVRPG